MPALREHARRDRAVDHVVLGEQDAQPGAIAGPSASEGSRTSARSVSLDEPATGFCATRNHAVKWNVVPSPSVLSIQILPPHLLDQLRGDRQAEPGAAVVARRRAIRLRERLEDQRLLFRRDADAGVRDREVQASARRRVPARPQP